MSARGQLLGTAAIPRISEAEASFRPPRALGVVDGGAVVGVTRQPSPTTVPPISDPLGFYRPDLGFRWLCGVPGSKPCPQRETLGDGDLLAVGEHWGWIQQDNAPDGDTQWPIRIRIRDGRLSFRAPTSGEERSVPDSYYTPPGPFFSLFSEAIAPFSLDAPKLRKRQPWGYSARARQNDALLLKRPGDAAAARIFEYQRTPQRGFRDYQPALAYGSRGVVWTTGNKVGYWDPVSQTVWKRPVADAEATLVDTAGRSVLVGLGKFSLDLRTTPYRLKLWRLPRTATPGRWSVLRRRLGAGDKLTFR